MSQIHDLKNAEKKVFRLATLDDGIWEIYLGLFFILMSFYSLTRSLIGPAWNLVLALAALLLLLGLVWLAKRRFVRPRTGVVRLGPPTRRKIKTANLITWGLVVATLALVILGSKNLLSAPSWEKLPGWFADFYLDLAFAIVIAGFFSLVAYAIDLPRFYLYGILLGAGNFAGTVLLVYQGVLFQWPVAVAGGIITLAGVYVFARFLQKRPLLAEEPANV